MSRAGKQDFRTPVAKSMISFNTVRYYNSVPLFEKIVLSCTSSVFYRQIIDFWQIIEVILG